MSISIDTYLTHSLFISIFYLTMFSYLILILIFFFILFNTNVLYMNSIELLKFIISNKFYLGSLLISLLSLMGLPPLLGFTIKLWQISFLFNKIHPIFLAIFLVYNIVITFFYLYIFVYIVETKKDLIKPARSNLSTFNKKFHMVIILLNSFNVLSLLVLNNVFDIFYFIASLLYI